jgi:predicted HicB family RNase H-like nuclease
VSPTRGTPTITFRIPPDLRAAVEARAAAEGTTVTAIVIAALQEYVKEEDQ